MVPAGSGAARRSCFPPLIIGISLLPRSFPTVIISSLFARTEAEMRGRTPRSWRTCPQAVATRRRAPGRGTGNPARLARPGQRGAPGRGQDGAADDPGNPGPDAGAGSGPRSLARPGGRVTSLLAVPGLKLPDPERPRTCTKTAAALRGGNAPTHQSAAGLAGPGPGVEGPPGAAADHGAAAPPARADRRGRG